MFCIKEDHAQKKKQEPQDVFSRFIPLYIDLYINIIWLSIYKIIFNAPSKIKTFVEGPLFSYGLKTANAEYLELNRSDYFSKRERIEL